MMVATLILIQEANYLELVLLLDRLIQVGVLKRCLDHEFYTSNRVELMPLILQSLEVSQY